MARTSRKKYVPRNPDEYKILRQCHLCAADGIITYRRGVAGTEHSCIEHVHRKRNKTTGTVAPRTITELLYPNGRPQGVRVFNSTAQR